MFFRLLILFITDRERRAAKQYIDVFLILIRSLMTMLHHMTKKIVLAFKKPQIIFVCKSQFQIRAKSGRRQNWQTRNCGRIWSRPLFGHNSSHTTTKNGQWFNRQTCFVFSLCINIEWMTCNRHQIMTHQTHLRNDHVLFQKWWISSHRCAHLWLCFAYLGFVHLRLDRWAGYGLPR